MGEAPRTPAGRVAVGGQVATATRFALIEQTRNRLAGVLLVVFVPIWYLLLAVMVGHRALAFRLFATHRLVVVDGRDLTLITAGMNALAIIVGFAVFAAVRGSLAFDRRLVFAGLAQRALIGAKVVAVAVVASSVALYGALVLLAFWRPTAPGFGAILAGFAVVALLYGTFGLFLGVLVRGDLEGFFLIIMVSLIDTFLQNPLGNPVANKPVLQWFPSFGPTQFAVGGSLGHTWLWGHLGLGLLWAAVLATAGLLALRWRTRSRLGGRRLAAHGLLGALDRSPLDGREAPR